MYKHCIVIFIWIALNLSVWGKLTSQLSIYWAFQSVNTVFIQILISVVFYNFMTLFVTLLKVLCVFAFFVSCWRASFYISCRLGLVLQNSLSICLYEKVFLLHILMIIFMDRIFWGESFSLPEFWECHSIPSWLVEFLLWNLLLA